MYIQYIQLIGDIYILYLLGGGVESYIGKEDNVQNQRDETKRQEDCHADIL